MSSREGGGASRPPLRVGRTKEYRMGSDTQLLAADGSPVNLFVLCGDRFEAARLFRSGCLSVHMIRIKGHPVSMASCTVGDHQWMLARDALVARLHTRVFVFELPGFFYAVVVPPDAGGGGASERKCATLAEIFSRFCAYQDLSNAEGAEEAGDLNQHSNPWVRAHARIQRLRIPTSPPGRGTADVPADRNAAVGSARQMQRAVRTSAVVKLLIRSLLAGALQPARHLTISLGPGSGAGPIAGTSPVPKASTAALPSKSVVSDLLNAIETSRATTARRGNGLGWWSLSIEGVMMLLRVVQAIRGRRQPAAPLGVGTKRPRDEGIGGAGHGGLKGGGGGGGRGGGGGPAFGGSAVRRWCGGTVGGRGSSGIRWVLRKLLERFLCYKGELRLRGD